MAISVRNKDAKYAKGDLLRRCTSEYPAGFVRSMSSDAKGIWYVVGFGRGRSAQQAMLREESAVLVRSDAETDGMLSTRRTQAASA